jgi:hypothetical protein
MRSAGSQAPASAAALRWLEGAFAGLQSELQSLRGHLNQQQATMAELVSGITQQQALLSELLDARDSDFRLAEAAEALPQFVSDAVAHEARVNRERTVAAVESTLVTKLAEANLEQSARGPSTEETVAELRTFLQNDPATGSIVAAISTQAATQAMRTEMAEQLPKVVNQALASSEARIDELAERMDKLLTRAVRAGARTAAVKADKPGRVGPPKSAAAKASAAPKTSGAAKATVPSTARATSSAKRSSTPSTKSAPPKAPKSDKAPASSRAAKAISPAKKAKSSRAVKKAGSKASSAGPAKRVAKTSGDPAAGSNGLAQRGRARSTAPKPA